MQKFIMLVLCLILIFSCCSSLLGGQEIPPDWQNRFNNTLRTGKIEHIREFFAPGFAADELESWKYQIKRGYLEYKSAIVIPFGTDAILIYIPTDSSSYSGENSDRYFDFIYRIYRVKPSPRSSHGFTVTERCMDDYNPDFLSSRETLEIFPAAKIMTVDSIVNADIKAGRLVFKLAKEFRLQSLEINGKKHPFQRFGYFVTARVNAPNPVSFRVKGEITAVSDHNQFFCIDKTNFFLRSGGFAATPCPPPDNFGRPYFSSDEAAIHREIRFPSRFKFLGYGDILKDKTAQNASGVKRRTVNLRLTEKYSDGLSFYAQADWNVSSVRQGNVVARFYFPIREHREQTFLENEIKSLLEWLNRLFKKDSDTPFTINFVVLEKFVQSGLLNDGTSIIASRASIIGSSGQGYIHELCHTAPQPRIDGNVLWIKEGFTNYLAFNFLRDIKGESDFWKLQKRRYLHRFGLYCEPLQAITNKGIPCYWSVYQKGPWIYRMLETELGKENFTNAMTALAQTDGQAVPDTAAYFDIIETATGKNLSRFRHQWLGRKNNPVLRVQHTVKHLNGKEKILLVTVSQEKPVFHMPLDIEIKTPNRTIRRTLQLDAETNTISVPIDSPPLSVQYDPDARLFAVIKTGSQSFVLPSQIHIPSNKIHYRFKSSKDNRIVEFQIKTGNLGIELYRREGSETHQLGLTEKLSPQTFNRNGKEIYSIDTVAGKIHFPDASYDIAEPVYPYQFAIPLFSMVNWEKTETASFVYLYNSGKSSSIITATREPYSKNENHENLIIRLDGFSSPIELYLKNGNLVKYTTGKDNELETFTTSIK